MADPDHPVRVGAAVTFVEAGDPRVPPRPVAGPAPDQGRARHDGQTWSRSSRHRPPAPEDVLGATATSRSPPSTCSTTSTPSVRTWADSDGAGGDRGPAPTTRDRGDAPSNRHHQRPVRAGRCRPADRARRSCCPGPRGAANQVDFQRQEDKELEAINTMDADVMSLEEVENSIKLYDAAIDGPDGADKDRDDALQPPGRPAQRALGGGHPATPVTAGPTSRRRALRRCRRWPSRTRSARRSSTTRARSRPSAARRCWSTPPAFRNAREPLAQAFKPLGGGRDDAFVVIVNHFKSKGGPTHRPPSNGDNVDSGDGAGFYNGDRKRQAAALVAFADQFAVGQEHRAVFLTGDFNAYSTEDPVQVIDRRRATTTCSRPTARRPTTSAVSPARSTTSSPTTRPHEMVTGEDVWEINANESVYYEYSRFNANATNLYDDQPVPQPPTTTRRSSASTSGTPSPTRCATSSRSSATNDFHGRILDDPGSAAAGAASLAGAVKQLRAENPDTVFAAAGDLIGASTFESFIAERQADHRRPQRGRPRGVRGGQPRVRPGLRRPGQPGDGALRRRPPRGWRRVGVHRRNVGSATPRTATRPATRAARDLVQGRWPTAARSASSAR